MRSRGISAIEVLAITVVLGLVAAFTIPMLGNGKLNAQRSNCLQNMKQIGASVLLYANDFDGVYPRTSEEKPKRGLGAHWSYLVQPFARSKDIFVCPSDTSPEYTSDGSVDTPKRVPQLSYINNYAVIPAHDFYPVPMSALTDPAGLILLAERRHETLSRVKIRSWKGTSGFFPGQPCSDQELGLNYRRTSPAEAESVLRSAKSDKDLLIARVDWTAHEDAANYTFADGHASYEKLPRTLDSKRFQWGERFYPRSMPVSDCDGHPHPRLRKDPKP